MQSKKKSAPWQCAKCHTSTVDFRTRYSCQKCSFDICKQCVDLLQSDFTPFAKIENDPICQLIVLSSHVYLVTKSGKLYTKPLQTIIDVTKAAADPALKLVSLPSEDKVAKVAASNSHVLVLLVSGQVLSQGCNNFGQLGVGDCESREIFEPVHLQDNDVVSDIAVGESHSVFVLSNGTVLGCGLSTMVCVFFIMLNIHSYYIAVPTRS